MKYSGIDLHSNNSVVVVSDEADRVLVRRRVEQRKGTRSVLNDKEAVMRSTGFQRWSLTGMGRSPCFTLLRVHSESSQVSRSGLRRHRGGPLGRVERSTCSMARRLVSRFARA